MNSAGPILFLLRSYNDIDHIAPIIWKAATSGVRCRYFFSGQDHASDYRICFLAHSGAQELHSPLLRFYHKRIRGLIRPYHLKRIADYIISYSIGSWILVTNRIDCLVNEWSGPYGREMAEYLIRSSYLLRRRCISVPHGYHFWTNPIINKTVSAHVDKFQKLPSFTNRSKYTHYVVQTNNIRDYYLSHRMPVNKLRVLGSARFCSEWRKILNEITPTHLVARPDNSQFVVLIFIPDWNYFIDRSATISLIRALSMQPDTLVLVKQNTRGTGTITNDELGLTKESVNNTVILGDEHHSVDLIRQADCIINFASSIGLEALAQGKIVCNPHYLTENTTIFDNSGVTLDTSNEIKTIRCINDVRCNRSHRIPTQKDIDRFLCKHVNAGRTGDAVLEQYLSLIIGY